MTGHDPYDGRPDEEIESLYEQHLFPSTSGLGFVGEIIARCWRGEYSSADNVYTNVQELEYC